MGLYEALDVLVGAALLACAPAVGCPMPVGAVSQGAAFSALLRTRGEAEPVGNVLDALAREIWLSQETKGLSLATAEELSRALADALESCRPLLKDVVAAIGVATSGAAGRGGSAEAVTSRIAGDVVARAVSSRLLAGSEWSAELAGFLLERTFAQLLAEPGLIASLIPAFSAFIAASGRKPQPGLMPDPASLAVAPREPIRPPPPPAQVVATSIAVQPAAAALVPIDDAVAADGGTSPLERLRQRNGLSSMAIGRLLELLEKRRVAPAQRLGRLEELAAWITVARGHLLQPSNEPMEVRRLNSSAAAALAEADFATAAVHLEQVRRLMREQRRGTERRLREELACLQQQQAAEAEATSDLAELAFARHEFHAAALLFKEAAECLPPSERGGALRLLIRQADALRRNGEEEGPSDTLRQAAQIYAEALGQARSTGDGRAAALADLGLGQVLRRQADRNGDPALLKEAVAALRRALAGLPRQQEAALCAQAGSDLGSALAMLAVHEQTDITWLHEAADAYQDALAVLSRETNPLRWALTEVELGGAMAMLAERSGERRYWLSAATALFAALEVFEDEGASEHSDLTRSSLRQFHERLPAALALSEG